MEQEPSPNITIIEIFAIITHTASRFIATNLDPVPGGSYRPKLRSMIIQPHRAPHIFKKTRRNHDRRKQKEKAIWKW